MHGAILFWAIGAFPDARDLSAPESQPIPVEVVSATEVTKIKAGDPAAEKEQPAASEEPEEPSQAEEKAETERPEPKRASAPEPEPAPEPETTEPAPEPVAEKPETASAPPPPRPSRKPAQAPENSQPLKREREVAKKPEPKKERKETESRPEERPEKKQRSQPEKKQREFNSDRIAALLDKRPDAGPQRTSAVADRPEAEAPEQPARGSNEGRDVTMSLSEIDALRQRISQCWNPPVGGLGAESIRVKLRLQLDRDGRLNGRPQVVNSGRSSFFRAAADSAVRAVMLCQPYDLPAEKHALWRDMILNFDPREMFGG